MKTILSAMVLSLIATSAPAADALTRRDQIAKAFQPFRTEQVTLSPDGNSLAYSLRNEGEVTLIVADAKNPAVRRMVASRKDGVGGGVKEAIPTRLSVLSWANPDRLIFAFGPDIDTLYSFDARGALAASRALATTSSAPAATVLPDEVVELGPILVEGVSRRRPRFLVKLISGEEARFVMDPKDVEQLLNPEMEEKLASLADGPQTDDQSDVMDSEWQKATSPGAAPNAMDASIKGRLARQHMTANLVREGYVGPSGVRTQRESNTIPTQYRRKLRLAQTAGDDSAHLLVEATGGTFTEKGFTITIPTALYQIDLATGGRKELLEQAMPGRALYDRSGRLRILLQAIDANGAQDYVDVTKPEQRKSWKPLDTFLGRDHARTFSITPANYLGERSFPLGFDYDPDVLYYASNVGRDTHGIYALNLKTRQSTEVAAEKDFDLAEPTDDLGQSLLVFDRSRQQLVGLRVRRPEARTRWLDQNLAEVQAALDRKLAPQKAQIVEWDDARAHFLIFTGSSSDPGRYCLFNPKEDRIVELLRRVPGFEPHSAVPFAIDRPGGEKLTGLLMLPRAPVATPTPLVVYCADGPWQPAPAEYNREVQALANLGFAVAQINYRGSAGFGRRHLQAAHGAVDRAPLEDIVTSIGWLASHHPIDQQHVALVGRGLGGYIALRGLQLYPDVFRCAVVMQAPLDVPRWLGQTETQLQARKEKFKRRRGRLEVPVSYRLSYFSDEMRSAFFGGDAKSRKTFSPIGAPASLTKPLLFTHDSMESELTEEELDRFCSAVAAKGGPKPDGLKVDVAFARRLPQASTDVFLRIDGLFKLSLLQADDLLRLPPAQ